WPSTSDAATPDASVRAQTLARFFHKGHADEWCAQMHANELNALRDAVKGTKAANGDATAICDACTAIVPRHARVGTPEREDTTAEPLCRYVAGDTAALVYQIASTGMAS